MIRELGLHVLEEACRQWQAWQVELNDEPAFTVSVNVSPRQLRDPGFVSEVWRILTKAGLPPSHLTLEITESFMVDDPESARARLRELKTLGVRISMDDFGTGYSSLASLQDLPLDILKIDKLFVDHVAEDPRRTAFAQAIIRMGKTLGLGLIAEGVETADQAERLQSLGCRFAQGFYFSRPVPADEIQRMLHASHAMRVGGRWAEIRRTAEPADSSVARLRRARGDRVGQSRGGSTSGGSQPAGSAQKIASMRARMSGVSRSRTSSAREVLADLLHATRTGDHRRDMRVGGAPGDRELRGGSRRARRR